MSLLDLLLVIDSEPVERLVEARENFGFVGHTAHIGMIDSVFACALGQARQVGHGWQPRRERLALCVLFARGWQRFRIELPEVELLCAG
ncbi:MAG: hypothetical protein DCC55_11710 [Chloroflexi bacterium]|nr:MAG: hypothetical protein DCC55_11710 [Chloroflexota bacterium]